MKKNIFVYVPVLHDGYRQFFERHADNADLYILGNDLIREFSHLAKEIRQLDPELVKKAIESWGIVQSVSILTKEILMDLVSQKREIVMPKEDVMLKLWDQYFPKHEVLLDTTFLRWDKHNTVSENTIQPDVIVSSVVLDQEFLKKADFEAEKSSDWWRRIGCVVVKDRDVILSTHNRHLPSEHTPYVFGDPRNNFHKGVHLELGTSIHSEAGAIAEAAKRGVSLDGTQMYVTTFPCPPCAKLIACSGVKKIYYRVGYGVLDGESILKQYGVEIVQVME